MRADRDNEGAVDVPGNDCRTALTRKPGVDRGDEGATLRNEQRKPKQDQEARRPSGWVQACSALVRAEVDDDGKGMALRYPLESGSISSMRRPMPGGYRVICRRPGASTDVVLGIEGDPVADNYWRRFRRPRPDPKVGACRQDDCDHEDGQDSPRATLCDPPAVSSEEERTFEARVSSTRSNAEIRCRVTPNSSAIRSVLSPSSPKPFRLRTPQAARGLAQSLLQSGNAADERSSVERLGSPSRASVPLRCRNTVACRAAASLSAHVASSTATMSSIASATSPSFSCMAGRIPGPPPAQPPFPQWPLRVAAFEIARRGEHGVNHAATRALERRARSSVRAGPPRLNTMRRSRRRAVANDRSS